MWGWCETGHMDNQALCIGISIPFILGWLTLELPKVWCCWSSQTNDRNIGTWAVTMPGLFVGCLMSQQHASVSQGRICSDNCTCFHTERGCRSNFLPRPFTVYWHQANQSQIALHHAGQRAQHTTNWDIPASLLLHKTSMMFIRPPSSKDITHLIKIHSKLCEITGTDVFAFLYPFGLDWRSSQGHSEQ